MVPTVMGLARSAAAVFRSLQLAGHVTVQRRLMLGTKDALQDTCSLVEVRNLNHLDTRRRLRC